MNKLTIALGAAALAVLAGCKDPAYQYRHNKPQNEVKDVTTEPVEEIAESAEVVVDENAKNEEVEVAEPAAEPEMEFTLYTVRRGDYLAKISKRYNITIDSIKRLNNLNGDLIRIGQKLKLPGKIDLGSEPAKETTEKPTKSTAKTFKPYEGETEEYVVKRGDTLGGIAYGRGINIRQLKALNSLSSDMLKIGQKLKVPANKAKGPSPIAEKQEVKEQAVQETSATNVLQLSSLEDAVVEPSAAESTNSEADSASDGEAGNNTVNYQEITVDESLPDVIAVAARYSLSPADIREINNLSSDELTVGQKLKIPVTGDTH